MVEGFRLSPQQRRLWLLQQGDGAAYRARCAVLVEGELDERALREALRAVVNRHQILATTFHSAPGISLPVQVIADGGAAPPPLEQLGPPPGTGADADAAERLAAELFSNAPPAPFDFERGPLLRAALAPAPNGAHVLLLELPALCADSRSLYNLVRDLARHYAARGGEEVEEPTQYVQFSEWQNELLEEPEAEGTEFWRRRDHAALPAPALPGEKRDGARDAFAPARFTTDIDPDLFARVEAAARRHRARPDAFLLACWQTLLWRLTGQDELVVGVAFDGRKYEELHDALGLFAKTVPVYADFSRPQTFAATLKRIGEAAREADLWQEYFEPGETHAARRGAQAHEFMPVQFAYEEQEAATFDAGAARFTLARHESIFDRYHLKLNCRRAGASLRASFGYDAGALTEEGVRLVARCFVTLLSSAADSAEAEAGALDITSEEDWRRVRAALAGPRRASPQGGLIHELFEETAARTPDETAVVAAGRRLSYAQLNATANRIARFLLRHGVGPDATVGLCVERSPEMLAGLLGVLKAGGAYVPLDPELPEARLAHQLADSSVRVLITQQRLRARFPDFEGVVLDLDDDAARLEGEAHDNPRRAPVAPDNLAYVIYTSGSTGTPKGVGVTHGGLSNYTRYLCERLGLPPEAAGRKPLHFAVVTTISADLGNTCIFPSLVSGGCLHVVSYEAATDAVKFADYLAEHDIDVLKIVPSHLGALLEPLEERRVFPRRFLIMGGEALPFALARRLSAISGDCRLVNHYGPTETTVGSLTFDLGEDLAEVAREATTIPVGRPIANTRVYILDAHLKPVPAGVGGELYIGGDGLARGYLGRAGQTAERFVPDPFADEAGARMYRTGDVARLVSGDAVEFLGRVDHQVKVRGYRIELGEIEAALREHASVREAVAVAREDEAGQKRLVAYCVPRREPGPTASELRDFLAHRLPAYMLPAAFVTLKALPLTPNGKVNRAELPDPGHARPDTDAAYAAPRGPVEETLAAIWKEVLELEQVGRDDNFFELGGDSIISIQIVARANRAGLRLDPRLIFEHPTVAQLAKNTTLGESAAAEQDEVVGPVPLTPIQHWFFDRRLSEPEFYTQSLMLEARQPLDAAALGGALAHLLRHHDALRMRYTRGDDGAWRQHNAGPDDRVPLTSYDLSGLAADEQRRRVEEASREAFSAVNLPSGPLVSAAYFDRGASAPALLLLVIHHLVVDGVSWRVLMEDLQTVYGQLLRGAPSELPAKTTSFKRWAERLADYARSEELAKESDYWLGLARQLAGGDGAARLPRDGDGANTLESARTVTAALTAEETRALLQRVPEAYRTQINDALLAALGDALAAWAGARGLWRLPVSLEGHGREAVFEDADVTRTVGWFTSRYPVVLERGEGEGAGEALRRTKEMLRGVPGRGVGYGVLRYMGEDAGVREELKGLDAATEVSFNYLGQFDQAVRESSLFKFSEEPLRGAQSSGGMLSHLLRVNARVVGGRLEVMWTFSENIFRRPTVEELAERYLASLRALIDHCLSREATSYTPADFPDAGLTQRELDLLVARIGDGQERDNLEDVYALSPMQEAMLFQTLFDPSSDAYFRQLSFRLHGELDAAAFRGAWRRAVEHHATLRTSFFWEGVGSPVQVVRRHVELPLEEHDWRGLAPEERESRLEAFLASERGRAFDLARAPLVRLALLRLEDDLYQFVWSYHHLLMDGWSRGLINRDVLALYEADRAGRDVRLSPPRPYREYIRWLRQTSLDGAEAFWRRTLEGFSAPTSLPPGRGPAAGDRAAAGDSTALVRAGLSADETEALLALSRRHQLTPGTVVQGAWALLLGRLSGGRDVVFGTVVSGRPAGLRGSEEMVGLFINTLPVRARLAPDEGLMTWLGSFQRQLAELREYEHSPLSEVQRWGGVPQGRPLFQSTLNFGNYFVDSSLHEPRADFRISGAHFVERIHQSLVLAAEMGPTVRLSLLYDGRLYEEREAARILESFVALLGEMVARPGQTLSALLAADDAHGDAHTADDGDDSKAQFAF